MVCVCMCVCVLYKRMGALVLSVSDTANLDLLGWNILLAQFHRVLCLSCVLLSELLKYIP